MSALVVGLGWMGQVHLRTYLAQVRRGEVAGVWVSDVDAARVASVCRAHPEVARWEGGLPRVASVCVPPDRHLEVASPLLARGVHVLVEKPLALSLSDARALCEVASRPGSGRLFTGHSERFNPGARVARGVLGVPRCLEAVRHSRSGPRRHEVDVVRDLMIHDLDLALTLFGADVVEVCARGKQVEGGSLDEVTATLRWRGGQAATLSARRVGLERRRCWRIEDDRGVVEVDLLEGTASRGERFFAAPGEDDAMTVQLREFLCASDGASGPGWLATGEQGVEALALALRVIEACDGHKKMAPVRGE